MAKPAHIPVGKRYGIYSYGVGLTHDEEDYMARSIPPRKKPPTIIPGTRYGSLVATGNYIPGYTDENNKRLQGIVECKCDCGSISYKQFGNLNSGKVCSCSYKCPYGIYKAHGLTYDENGKNSKEYHAWNRMIRSCDNPKHKDYRYNGGKGITYHESLSTIQGFWKVMGKAPSKYHRLTRIDRDGDFEPGNVHWYCASTRRKK